METFIFLPAKYAKTLDPTKFMTTACPYCGTEVVVPKEMIRNGANRPDLKGYDVRCAMCADDLGRWKK